MKSHQYINLYILIWFSTDLRIKVSHQHNSLEKYAEITDQVVLNCYTIYSCLCESRFFNAVQTNKC